jgi:hypothetical protein
MCIHPIADTGSVNAFDVKHARLVQKTNYVEGHNTRKLSEEGEEVWHGRGGLALDSCRGMMDVGGGAVLVGT